MKIKNGALDYETLLTKADELMREIEVLFAQNPCALPEQVNQAEAEQALIQMRKQLYR